MRDPGRLSADPGMNATGKSAFGAASAPPQDLPDSGLAALALVAGYFRISADPLHLAHELALSGRAARPDDLVRAAQRLGLKARLTGGETVTRLQSAPLPAIIGLKDGGFALLAAGPSRGLYRLVNAASRAAQELDAEALAAVFNGDFIRVTRRLGGPGITPTQFSLSWFIPSIWRYRKPLSQVLLATLFVQALALVTPIFFQLVVDKVLVHRSWSTLVVLLIGLVVIGLFESLMQYLRAYVLTHTTNRIDVELGRRLFHHLFRLPLSYFETRPTGQTVARVRELENVRAFLTGQALTSVLDLVFALAFLGILFLYSPKLTLVVAASIPVYILIAALIRPLLKQRIEERFERGAQSQQFLVESVVGAHTLKAAAVEPLMQVQWEEKLAAYVRTSFASTMLGTLGQTLIQHVSKVTTALILFFGATAVIEGAMTVGELIAFNMIAAQAVQPILRLSQLWQDFQQVQVSIARLGDVLNHPPELSPPTPPTLRPLQGHIEFRAVNFRYKPEAPLVLRNLNLTIRPGEVVGVVGPSGSGKSTIAKLIQRFYVPDQGQVLIDGMDVTQMDAGWLRRQIGVVLQENLLFNRSIHDNIALGAPTMPRSHVINMARLAGADEFINTMPAAYDTIIEERGANLSGGQRQRIAIARALATNPRILILDEATSALDYESERIIQRNMSAIVKGRTVFIVAHRLAAVRHCDRIIGLAQGNIVEQGTHDELLKRPNGLYAHLWSLQNDAGKA